MNRLAKIAPVAALAVGPLAAWLVWAIVNRKPFQAGAALVANIALWTGGPAIIAWAIGKGIV